MNEESLSGRPWSARREEAARVRRAAGSNREVGRVVRCCIPDGAGAVLRIPHDETRALADLLAASRSMVWHDPGDADDPFWNPQANDETEARHG